MSEFKDKDTYKPDVKLEYIDDNGRLLNPKEAFRYLSHKFHGKGSGKNKTEKRMKKLQEEAVRDISFCFKVICQSCQCFPMFLSIFWVTE